MGLLGVLMLCGIFLYPLRKRWAWLQKQGSSKHWLDHHVVLGVAAPVCIAFHSSFKFRGLAGIAFWVMVAVALSGLIGRYLYAQIPRQVAAAESVTEDVSGSVGTSKDHPSSGSATPLVPFTRAQQCDHAGLPSPLWATWSLSDLARPFRVARLRLRVMGVERGIRSLGGCCTKNLPARRSDSVSPGSRRCFPGASCFSLMPQQVFKLWHVVHKPFSYAFAVLALVHIVVAMLLGFF